MPVLPLLALGLLVALVVGARVVSPAGLRVYGMSRARGLDARLLADLSAWNGPFALTVGMDGGVREGPEAAARQADYYRTGRSLAATLAETPHGRGGAVDLYPTEPDGALVLDEADPRWELMGSWFERRGRVWGGRWRRPDRPHVELADWRHLPFPPRRENVA